jgi:hypothetical protein
MYRPDAAFPIARSSSTILHETVRALQPLAQEIFIPPGARVAIDHASVVIPEGIPDDSEVTFTAPEVFYGSLGHIGAEASIFIDAAYAHVSTDGMGREAVLDMQDGRLIIDGAMARRARVTANEGSAIIPLGKQSPYAAIIEK